MSNYQQPAPQGKDPILWEIAQRRASFKSHALVYALVNILLWGLWFFNSNGHGHGYPWPIWTTLGWGVGLSFHFAGAYIFPKTNSVEREYEKLSEKNLHQQ
ncbi:MAG: 2TM domain-containing protein [Gloeobacteraceae cyanobacterium ES-bin-316]|nr:2TM domain-containing protein [Ferruginibacter sp.]